MWVEIKEASNTAQCLMFDSSIIHDLYTVANDVSRGCFTWEGRVCTEITVHTSVGKIK